MTPHAHTYCDKNETSMESQTLMHFTVIPNAAIYVFFIQNIIPSHHLHSLHAI